MAFRLAGRGRFAATGAAGSLLVRPRTPGRRIVGSRRLATDAAHVLSASPHAPSFASRMSTPALFGPRAFAARAPSFAGHISTPALFAACASAASGAARGSQPARQRRRVRVRGPAAGTARLARRRAPCGVGGRDAWLERARRWRWRRGCARSRHGLAGARAMPVRCSPVIAMAVGG